MKLLLLIVLLFACLMVGSPAQAQNPCTPPQDAQVSATNVTGQYTAWAVGNVVAWCSSGGSVVSYEATYIDILYFDGFWLPYNLYFGYSVDGYLFQMNVSTGQGYLISPHGQPSGDPGEGGGSGQSATTQETIGINPTVEPSFAVARQPYPLTFRLRLHGWL